MVLSLLDTPIYVLIWHTSHLFMQLRTMGKKPECGKIISRMNTKNEAIKGTPPKLIPSFVSGFNVVTSHVQLIIFPIIMDLLIWFAPRVRVKSLVEPLWLNFVQTLGQMSAPEMSDLLNSTKQLWTSTVERFNLLSMLRTFPIGIPSLLAGRGILESPFGNSQIYELPSFLAAAAMLLFLLLVGIAGGSLFFSEIARLSCKENYSFSLKKFSNQFLQTVAFTFGVYLILLIISMPIGIVISLISLISPTFTQIAIILVSLLLIWLLIPFVFSLHGIYTYQQNVFVATFNSVRLVRFFLPATGIFLLFSILISEGLDLLWSSPPETSWLLLVGILGHAFIVTGLITSSFIYYRGGVRWMNENLMRISESLPTS